MGVAQRHRLVAAVSTLCPAWRSTRAVNSRTLSSSSTSSTVRGRSDAAATGRAGAGGSAEGHRHRHVFAQGAPQQAFDAADDGVQVDRVRPRLPLFELDPVPLADVAHGGEVLPGHEVGAGGDPLALFRLG